MFLNLSLPPVSVPGKYLHKFKVSGFNCSGMPAGRQAGFRKQPLNREHDNLNSYRLFLLLDSIPGL